MSNPKDISPAEEATTKVKMAIIAIKKAIETEKKERLDDRPKDNIPAGERAMQNGLSPAHF